MSKLQLLKWFHQFCRLMDGIVGVTTLGYVYSNLGLWSSKLISRQRTKQNNHE